MPHADDASKISIDSALSTGSAGQDEIGQLIFDSKAYFPYQLDPDISEILGFEITDQTKIVISFASFDESEIPIVEPTPVTSATVHLKKPRRVWVDSNLS